VLFPLLVKHLGVVDPSNKDMTLQEKIAARRSTVDAFVQTLNSLEKLDEAMKTINIAWGEIRNPVDISHQPTIASRNSIVQMDDREGGTRPITQSPYRFSNAESGVRGPAPHRGEHNEEILSDWLGLSTAEISSLQTEDVILFDADWKHH
jgi:crotonobetainyl-CoA:carnitine CoA-transferase CaiB-like acyl-CoA transferase